MKKLGKSTKKGFTLVELIVVLVILAVLAAMLVPALTGYIKRAKQEKDYQAASAVYAAAQAAITEAYGKGTLTPPASGETGTFNKTSDTNGVVYDLAGVDSSKVTDYSFTYNENLIITSGSVKIKSGKEEPTYYLRADGTWGNTATTS